MSSLREHFDRVTILSLPARHDRRERLAAHLTTRGLDGGLTWQAAVDGSALPQPEGWSAGNGGWGCLQSHLETLRRALKDGVERLLILEDDVIFSPHTAACLPHLMQALPPDWGQLYLGGQHIAPPQRTASPLLWQAGNINRTHAWACSRQWMPQIIAHLSRTADYALPPGTTGWHMDHQLGAAHQQSLWPCYTASWWLAGQEADHSDICAQSLRRRWWHPRRYALSLPFVFLPPGTENGTAYCTGTEDEAFAAAIPQTACLLAWLHRLAEEALDHGCLPAWRSPLLPASRVAALWPAGIRNPDHICQDYPFNGLFRHDMVTILQACA